MPRCATIKASGERCGAMAVTGYSQCYVHAPELAERRKRSNRKGGETGGRGRPKDRMEGVHRITDHLLSGLLKGDIDPSVAAVAAQLANVKIRATLADLKIQEQLELEQRVEQLTEALERQQEVRRRGA